MRKIQKSPLTLSRWQIWLVSLWTLFTVVLASWWMMFSLRLVEKLSETHAEQSEELLRHQRMLMSEGSILLLSLIAGGAALLVYMVRERAALLKVRNFFATYTHDLKTALASLRLQTESLYEDLQNQPQQKLLNRLLQDTVRLEVQLENSLLLADPKTKLLIESISPHRIVESLEFQFVDRQIKNQILADLQISADQRAFEAVIRNVLHNSFHHGKANAVTVQALTQNKGNVTIQVSDDGLGFKGERSLLTKPFMRHTATSGSGLGLYLVRNLVERMGGCVEFPPSAQGFVVQLHFPERLSGALG